MKKEKKFQYLRWSETYSKVASYSQLLLKLNQSNERKQKIIQRASEESDKWFSYELSKTRKKFWEESSFVSASASFAVIQCAVCQSQRSNWRQSAFRSSTFLHSRALSRVYTFDPLRRTWLYIPLDLKFYIFCVNKKLREEWKNTFCCVRNFHKIYVYTWQCGKLFAAQNRKKWYQQICYTNRIFNYFSTCWAVFQRNAKFSTERK